MTEVYSRFYREGASPVKGPRARARDFMRGLALDGLSWLSPMASGSFLKCLFCHYVFDDQVAAFERILRSLMEVGQFIDTDRCLQMLSGERPVDGRYFHLSFDDGFRNNFTNAMPVLKGMSIPALFFVPTAFVNADWQRAKEYCFSTSEAYSGVIEMARWDDLKATVDAGFEVGSHTRHHVRLSDVSCDSALLHDEIEGAKEELEKHLNVPCRFISWPYGRLEDIDETALGVIRSSHYSACFSAVRGGVVAGKTDPFMIPRHHFEPQWPVRHVRYFACVGHEKD